MDTRKFATWKYKHEGAGYRSRWQLIGAAVLLASALAVYFKFHFLPASSALLVIALIVLFLSTKKILLGPRYLICGNAIVYYNNVASLTLDEATGQLRLLTASKQTFLLERDKFPTNARKADKIKRNKAAKFSKVAANIIDRVKRAAPDVHIDAPA